MRQERFECSRFAVVFVIVCGLLVVQAAGVSAQNEDSRVVTLTAVADEAGGCTITVDPEIAVISRSEDARITKVDWVAQPNEKLGKLFWELRYDPGKGGASKNYFGGVDLGCGKASKKIRPEIRPTTPNAEWPYMVTVYRCKDGNKSEYLCTVDPRIKWND